ncbi:MAG: glycogen debranching protein [Acidobacteria bacterium]|nr:MAG: glycogen debranching protein [Acidobacteriota bacterium]
MRLGPDVLRDPARASLREWLHTDGLGGYASSTAVGLNTRRYHGLLVVATRPPVGRMVLLSKLEETLGVGGRRYDLGTNAYPGAIHPRGFEWAASFELDPLPTLTWEVEGGIFSRTVCRVHDEPLTAVAYRYDGAGSPVLELRPLLAYRDHHALQRENAAVRAAGDREGTDVVLRPYDGCPPLRLRLPGSTWIPDGLWYRAFEYERERERGLEFREDLFSPGVLRVELLPGRAVHLLASAGTLVPAVNAERLMAVERRRLRVCGGGGEGALPELRRAADAFIVRRGLAGRTIIAGYPWFADWGRDSMISLPGLCLATGRPDDARAVLAEYARHLDGGMIPNRFPDGGEEPEYNAVDAALWMVVAVGRYLEATADAGFVRMRMADAVASILAGYRDGTRHGIRMDDDGLIVQGEEGLQLTWMDARIGTECVTPRRGRAVEVQALWYNALLIGADVAREAAEPARAREWTALAGRARESFLRIFWSEERGYLADVVGADGQPDYALRPNQLYALGLPHALLPRDRALRVLDAVRRHLLTPVGLRTLSPEHPAYRGRYAGGPAERDAAYHQGTVWPFLAGAYFDAVTRVHGEAGKAEAREWLDGFAAHLEEAGLGTVSEVFDGDAPHAPGGAIAQAWSVGEILRVAVRTGWRPALDRR